MATEKYTKTGYSKIQTLPIKPATYIKQEAYVNDEGIWIPTEEYALEGCTSTYRCLITKDLFIGAYNKWIKNDEK